MLTASFIGAIVAAFLVGWKGISLAGKAKTAYGASRALADAKKLIAKRAAEAAAYRAAVALVASQPAATGPTGSLPKFLLPTGASAAATPAVPVSAPAGPSGAANPTLAG